MTVPIGFALIAITMSKLLWVGMVASLGACTQSSSTPLAELNTTFGETQIEVVTREKFAIQLHVNTVSGCPTLGDDVRATFNGVEMEMSHGGYDTNASGCYPIAFWISRFPTDRMVAFERRAAAAGGGSEMRISDASATWTIAPTRLFLNELVMDASNSRVVWQDVSRISTATVQPYSDTRIEGSSIYFDRGTDIRYIDALAHPTPDLCDGPTTCMVNLERWRHFDPGTPN